MQLYEALFSTNSVLGNWIRTKNFRKNRELFVVHGVSARITSSNCDGGSKQIAREYLCKEDKGFLTEEEKLLTGDDGPLWYRGSWNTSRKRLPTKEHIARTLEILIVKK
jgi:hypothetical protein